MDQQKIGLFLKQLRGEKAVTQEQLAERLGVSNRSVSRWENGATMPDFDLLIELARYYDVEVGELLDGERSVQKMDKKTEETMVKVADYNNREKLVFTKKMRGVFIAGLGAYLGYMVIDICGLTAIPVCAKLGDFLLGLVLGALLLGVLYSTVGITKIRAMKLRLLGRDPGRQTEDGK